MEIFTSNFVKYQTIRGHDDWLFIWNIDGVSEIVTGQTRHNRVQLLAETRNIELREAWCKSRDIVYVHTIAPDKASIYPEMLPAGITYEPNGLLHDFSQELKQRNVKFVDLLGFLHELKVDRQVYFKTDSHWTYETAYKVLKLILEPVAAKFPSASALAESMLTSRASSKVMELAALVPEPQVERFNILSPIKSKAKCVYQTNSARGRIQVFENKDRSLPTCIIFRDSFSSFYMPILVESFSRTIVLNSRIFWYDLVEAEKPQVVIVEVAERYLDPVVIDLGFKSFSATFGVEIDEITSAGGENGKN